MKTNKAPEKIYISYEGYGVFGEDGSTERTKISQIEYSRTDAFIEKACNWLKSHVTYIHPRKGTEECVVNLNAFREAMKGE